jgi:hypothetical protein
LSLGVQSQAKLYSNSDKVAGLAGEEAALVINTQQYSTLTATRTSIEIIAPGYKMEGNSRHAIQSRERYIIHNTFRKMKPGLIEAERWTISPPVRSNETIGGDDGVISAASDSSVGGWFQRRIPGFQTSGVSRSLLKIIWAL